MEPFDEEPTPDLAYAPWPRRILSAVIDYFAVFFIAAPFLGSALSRVNEAIVEGKDFQREDVTRVFVTIVIVIVVYTTALHGWRGSTLGKIAARTKVVMDDGSPATWQVAFVRAADAHPTIDRRQERCPFAAAFRNVRVLRAARPSRDSSQVPQVEADDAARAEGHHDQRDAGACNDRCNERQRNDDRRRDQAAANDGIHLSLYVR